MRRVIDRRQTVSVDVGGVMIGSGHPIVVQSMTNPDTADADATAIQVAQLAHAGSELVRVTVNNDAAAEAVPVIREKLDGLGVGVPLIGDFHYNGHLLLTKYPACAGALARARYARLPAILGGACQALPTCPLPSKSSRIIWWRGVPPLTGPLALQVGATRPSSVIVAISKQRRVATM